MWLKLNGEGPLYQQVYSAMRLSILSGAIAEGERLTPSRKLSKDLGVSRNVVLIAYDQLKAEGYAEGQSGGGTRAIVPLGQSARLEPTNATSPDACDGEAVLSPLAKRALHHWQERQQQHQRFRTDLAYNFRYGDVEADATTLKQWKQLTGQYLNRPAIEYGDTQGTLALRESIAQYTSRARGCRCSAEQICIVNGSQQALDLVARLFIDKGTKVLIEDPFYSGAKAAFETADAQVQPIPVDEQGIDIEAAAETARGAKLIYVTPSHQFPTGAVMSFKRRLALLNWAEQNEAFIVEDDYDSEFRYTGQPIESLQGMDQQGRVLYVGTFSKVLFPALRLGYLILPKSLVAPTLALRWLTDRHTGVEQQQVLAQFIQRGYFEQHLRRMRRRYSKRRQALLLALENTFGTQVTVQGTNAGLHLLAWFHEINWNQFNQLEQAAAEANIGIYSVNPFYQNSPTKLGLLIGYASLNEEQISTGIARLGNVTKKLKRRD